MLSVVAALIEDGDKFLACQRPVDKARALQWEFLGGKVEKGETREQAIVRECREEIGVTVQAHGIVAEIEHEYPDFAIHLTLLRASIAEGEPQKLEHADIRWVTPEEAWALPFCEADKALLRAVQEDRQRRTQTMDHVKRARELFLAGYNCAQSVAGAFADEMGMPLDTVAKLASGFGGGMGCLRETCGTVTGMFMVVDMLYGYAVPGDNDVKTAHYARIRALAAEFEQENSALDCRDLLKALPGKLSENPTPRSEAYYKERPCVRFVESAARILEKMIAEEAK